MYFEYRDPWTPHTHLTYNVTRIHESFRSEFQQIDVFEAKDFGTVLCLGGVTNVTDRDESAYHEMIAHVPLMAHANPRRVLIIGGGDGGVLREVLRHPEVERAVLVDIDAEVIRVSRAHFPHLAAAMDDPRAEVIVGDGLAYVANAAKQGERFDVILIDSTDPVDAAVELFTEAFYRDCAKVAGDDGIVVPQSDSPVFYSGRTVEVQRNLARCFRFAQIYVGLMVAYPAGIWGYCLSSNGVDLNEAVQTIDEARFDALEPQLRFFNRGVYRWCAALPTFLQRKLDGQPGLPEPSLGDDPNTYDPATNTSADPMHAAGSDRTADADDTEGS